MIHYDMHQYVMISIIRYEKHAYKYYSQMYTYIYKQKQKKEMEIKLTDQCYLYICYNVYYN